MKHGIIKGAKFEVDEQPPRLQLHGLTFELLPEERGDGHFMHLQLRRIDLSQQTRDLTTFLPRNHWRRPLERDVAIGERIARAAGLEAGDMSGFLDFWNLRAPDMFPFWLNNDLCGVQHPCHIPRLIPAEWVYHINDEDVDSAPLSQNPPCMAVSTMWSGADMPQIRCSFPGTGAPARADVVTGLALPRLPLNGWVVRTTGHVDTKATHNFMTRTFAEEIGLRAQDIDLSLSGSVFEVHDRPGGSYQLSYRRHRGSYHGLGRIVRVPMLLSKNGEPDRCVLGFVIVEDGTIGSSIDFVLDPSFARSLKHWVHDAMCPDPLSQSFARGLYLAMSSSSPSTPEVPLQRRTRHAPRELLIQRNLANSYRKPRTRCQNS